MTRQKIKHFSEEEIALAKQWIDGKIGITDIGKALNNPRNHAGNYAFIAQVVRYMFMVENGRLENTVAKTEE